MPKLTKAQYACLVLERNITEISLQRLQALSYKTFQDRHSQEQLRQKLLRIEEAICRNQSNVYGLCHSCGQPIDPQRLHILPYAEFCLSCQIKVERMLHQKSK